MLIKVAFNQKTQSISKTFPGVFTTVSRSEKMCIHQIDRIERETGSKVRQSKDVVLLQEYDRILPNQMEYIRNVGKVWPVAVVTLKKTLFSEHTELPLPTYTSQYLNCSSKDNSSIL